MSEWDFYFAQLAGKNPETTPGRPHTGIYRQKTSGKNPDGARFPLDRSVYIWWQGDECFCQVSGGYRPTKLDEIDELFSRVCRNAVTRAQYDQFTETGKWWDHVDMPSVVEAKNGLAASPAMGHNNPPETLPVYKQIEAKINETLDESRKWLKGIGGVKTKEHADKAANFAEAFARFEKQAEKTFEAEKLPYDTALKEIRANWKPVISLAEEKKKALKQLVAKWAVAEQERRDAELKTQQAEYAKAQEEAAAKAAELARSAGGEVSEPPPVDLPPPPEKAENVAVGTAGRKVALKTYTVYEVADKKAFLRWVLENLSPFPDELIEPLAKLARRLGPQLTTLPQGVTKKEEKRVA